jgi:23S rRNA (adenine2503-C2)-methyltransferase
MNCRVFESSNKDVKKFVFSKDKEDGSKDIAVEAVLYRYGEYKTRTVICCSTQCGCPVGCSFCGTGKFFIRSLTCDEICEQVTTVLSTIDCETSEIKKFQIMFMSMGEPFLNYNNLDMAIRILHERYPNAQLLVSTSAPTSMKNHFNEFIALSKEIDKVGLQFSVHESLDENRRKLIPTNTSTLKEIS